MKKKQQSPGRRLYVGLMGLLLSLVAATTIGAMQVNPPTYIDGVVLGHVSEDLVEDAVATEDDTMLQAALSNRPLGYFAIVADEVEAGDGPNFDLFFDGRPGRDRGGFDGGRGRGFGGDR